MNQPGSAPVDSPLPAVAPRPGEGRARSVAGWARTHAALLVLLAVPFAVFGIPQLFDHALLDGDNFIQNFPLRVLVGRDLAHGMLPLWNPYLFSGTPLLAGFNAAAAYPGTWLMAVLPVFVAWALVFAAVYDLALAGMYLFLRREGLCRAAAAFGAATFAFAGYMTAQIVHVDLIQGAAALPWMLLGVHVLTGRANEHGPVGGATGSSGHVRAGLVRGRGGAALVAVALGLSGLSGGVEAVIDGGVIVLIYWAGRMVALGYLRRRELRAVVTATASLLLGLAGGVALGAAQWIPGGAFVAQSQRGGASYAFFTTGSLPDRLLTLLVSPFVLGTNQDQPAYYVGPYNFQEVTGYVGILALIAACVLLVRRWRTRPEARHWWVWYVVLVIGVLSAVGNQTPFGRVLYLVPGLNSQRLLNRNLLLVDCALAVLLAWWSHLLLTERDTTGPRRRPVRTRWRTGQRAELIATSIPFALSAVLCLAFWVAGTPLDHVLEAAFPLDETTRLKLAPLVTAGTVIAGAATWIALSQARFSARTLRRLLAGVLAADLLLFNLFVIRPPVAEAAAQVHGPASAALAATVGDGRFVIYDPDRFFGDQLLAFGQTDLNVFTHVLSAQGYTALIDGQYYQATGAHLQEDLDPASLARPVWDNLNVTTLLSVPSYFVTPVVGAPATGYPFPGDVLTIAPGADGPFTLAPDERRPWYFGGVLTVERWSFSLEGGAGRGLRVGLLSAGGRLQWLPSSEVHRSGPRGRRTVEVDLPAPIAATGVVIQAGAGMAVRAPTATTVEAGSVRLDGPMQLGVAGSRWTFTGVLGSFGVFHNTRTRGWAWLEDPRGGPVPPGSTVSAAAPGPEGGHPIVVHATGPVLLDRSEAWSSGWRATVQSLAAAGRPAGPPQPAAVTRDGLVQRVALAGPGNYRVTFTYAPGAARLGLLVSAVAGAGMLLWGLVEVVLRWRRRPGRSGPAPGPGAA